jgi:uncharacterized protein YjbI with pentapeptide repeats
VDPVALKVLDQGKETWNEWRNKGNNNPDLADMSFENRDFSGYNLSNTNFARCKLSHCKLDECLLNGTGFDQASLSHCTFVKAHGKANFPRADFVSCDFKMAQLSGLFKGAKFSDCLFDLALFRRANFSKATFFKANLMGADFDGANLEEAILTHAVLIGTKLDNANLARAHLGGAALIGARVNASTRLTSAFVKHAVIDRLTLECLGPDHGGLSKREILRMTITDDLALLRANYSGFMQWFHVAALFLFLIPYLSFFVNVWVQSMLGDEPLSTIPLWDATLRYIWNGGRNWQAGYALAPIAFGIFCFSVLYNILRAVLLWKTKKLELEQEITGLPSAFSFEIAPKMRFWFKVAKWGFVVNWVLILFHTWHFFRIPVPGVPQ